MKPMLAFAFAILLLCLLAVGASIPSIWPMLGAIVGGILLHVVYPFDQYVDDVDKLMGPKR